MLNTILLVNMALITSDVQKNGPASASASETSIYLGEIDLYTNQLGRSLVIL